MGANRWLAALAAAAILPACGGDRRFRQEEAVVPRDPDIETFPDEGSTHVPMGTVIVYQTDPPTSGDHYPDPQDGGYFETPTAAPYLVHSMEHGGVIVYYNPATVTAEQKDRLKALAAAHPGIYSQVICVPRDDAAYPIILTAWTHRLRLKSYDQARIDGFLTLYLGQGPEKDPAMGGPPP